MKQRRLTKQDIYTCMTPKGGFTGKTLSILTGTTHPTSGWRNRLIGELMSEESYQLAVQASLTPRGLSETTTEPKEDPLKIEISKLKSELSELKELVHNLHQRVELMK